MGVGVTLTGTHSEGTYGLYGSRDLSNWTALDIEISGEDGVTTWNNCDVSPRPDAFFFQAAVEDNYDNMEKLEKKMNKQKKTLKRKLRRKLD